MNYILVYIFKNYQFKFTFIFKIIFKIISSKFRNRYIFDDLTKEML